MGLEVLTTYNLNDTGGFFAVSTFELVVTNVPRNVDAVLSDSKGVGHFGDFTHEGYFEITAVSTGGTAGLWVLSNIADDLLAIFGNDGLFLYANRITGNTRLFFRQQTGGAFVDQDIFNNAITGQRYWYTVIRTGVSAIFLLYTNAGKTVLVATLVIACDITTYEFIIPGNSYLSGSPQTISFKSGDINLNEAIAGGARPLINGGLVNTGLATRGLIN